MSYLSADDILNADDLPREPVEVPEWGGTVLVQGMSGTDRDRFEAAMLNKESRRAENETWMNLRDNGDGTYSGRFVIPELHGKLLKAHLDRLSSPKRWTRD